MNDIEQCAVTLPYNSHDRDRDLGEKLNKKMAEGFVFLRLDEVRYGDAIFPVYILERKVYTAAIIKTKES